LHDGYAGIALAFIHAFEQFQDPIYKKIAAKTLFNQQEQPIHKCLGLMNGLAGLGEVYLEAHLIFHEDVWLQRAEWIAQVVSRTSCYRNDRTCYWYTENLKESVLTADMSNGHCGPLHFLMRCHALEKLGFPFL
jgi:hypothetical protein